MGSIEIVFIVPIILAIFIHFIIKGFESALNRNI